MVRKTFFITLSTLFLSLNFAAFLIAGEFTANVSSTKVPLNETFSLSLTLKDASPKAVPFVSDLKKNFLIHGQQQSSNTTVINGKVSSSVTWRLSLTPKIEGAVQIPSITVDTGEGVLSTQPITLNVIRGPTPKSSVDSIGPKITAKVSNASPYKNEPLLYTALLTTKLPLYNVQTQKLQVGDAIVELLGEPKLEARVIGGELLNVAELTYLITPLKTGSLIIPPIAVQGAIPQKRSGRMSSFFDDDDLDLFAMMQGFERLMPFTLMTEEIPLNVLPAIPEVSPWLPAKALNLEEQWPSDQTLRVGEPFSRGFQITAEGLKASQLPHLEDLQAPSSLFKVYADKPEEQEKLLQGTIHSARKQQYTLIPQQAGTWELPEISISWWDSAKKEKKTSTIPARTVQILPAIETATPASQEKALAPTTTASPSAPISGDSPSLLYGIIGILTFFLIAALLWAFALQRKIARSTNAPSQKPIEPPVVKPKQSILPSAVQKEKKEKLPDLNPT